MRVSIGKERVELTDVDLLGVGGGWLINVYFYEVPSAEYWEFTRYFVNWWEPISGLIKSVFFGGSIGLIACYKGFHCRAGAEGVGRACTSAFVTSFLTILVVDFYLSLMFQDLYDVIWGFKPLDS